jgi:hypothetical protein
MSETAMGGRGMYGDGSVGGGKSRGVDLPFS